jgi:hypothetical protein
LEASGASLFFVGPFILVAIQLSRSVVIATACVLEFLSCLRAVWAMVTTSVARLSVFTSVRGEQFGADLFALRILKAWAKVIGQVCGA